MNKLLLYLLESGIGLLVFYLLYALVLRCEKCFAYNRFYLLLTPVLALVLPLVELPFLRQPEPLTIFVSEQLTPITITVHAAGPVPEAPLFSWSTGLLLLYATGAGFFIFRLLRQLYRLRLFAQQTQTDCFYWHNIPVHKTNGAQPTFSFGHRIFWDNSQPLSEAEIERILLHESVHVRQHHTLDILYLELLKCIFWFNPLLYFYQKALISTHEYIADAAVLRTTSQETYANLLVKQLFHRLEFSFGNYFNKSLTLKRMKMIKQQHRRSPKWKQSLVLPVLGALAFLLSSGNTLDKAIKNPADLITALPITPKIHDAGQDNFSEPLFPGGKVAMYEFLTKTLRYPTEGINANRNGGGIGIVVDIDEKGMIKTPVFESKRENKSLLPSVVPNSFEKEIYRVLAAMPIHWTPAMVNGKPTASRYYFNFSFLKLNPAEKITESLEKEEYRFDIDNKPFVTSRPIQVILYDPNIPLENKPDKPNLAFHNPKTTIRTPASTSGSAQTVYSLAFDNKIQFPLFPGGRQKMYEYLSQNISFSKYVALLGNNRKGAFISTQININENGQVTPAFSDADDAFAREINQAIRRMPAWQPAEVDGKPTAATYNLAFVFKKEVDEYLVGQLTEKLEKYTSGELNISAVLYGKKAYTVQNNPDEPVLTVVEQKPEFPGGIEQMYAFLNRHIKYPKVAQDTKLEGMISAKFIVTKAGNLLETRIEQHLSPETDAEILRIIKLMPKWTPGKQNNKPVNVEYTLPFKFRLSNQPLKPDETKPAKTGSVHGAKPLQDNC